MNSKNRLLKQKTQQQQQAEANQQIAKRSSSPKSDDSDEEDQFITSYETISIQVNWANSLSLTLISFVLINFFFKNEVVRSSRHIAYESGVNIHDFG